MEIKFKKRYLISAIAVSLICAFVPYIQSGDKLPAFNTGKGTSEETAPPVPEPEAKPAQETASNEYFTPIVYYSQSDPQWGNYLYGGSDPMASHGCGPTVLAMLVSTLTETALTPPLAADFAVGNGYWAYDSGSAHSLIPEGAAAYGLTSSVLNRRTADGLRSALTYNRLVVFLMGPGDFTSSGHFIIAYGVNNDGSIKVADPANPSNMERAFSADLILSQISSATDASGPIWVISKP